MTDLKKLWNQFYDNREKARAASIEIYKIDSQDVSGPKFQAIEETWTEALHLLDLFIDELQTEQRCSVCRYCYVEKHVAMAIWAEGLVVKETGEFVCWPCAHERYLDGPNPKFQVLCKK